MRKRLLLININIFTTEMLKTPLDAYLDERLVIDFSSKLSNQHLINIGSTNNQNNETYQHQRFSPNVIR